MSVYVLLAIESCEGIDRSPEDTKADFDDVKCTLFGSLEDAKDAAQASFDKSLGECLAEDEPERYRLDWRDGATVSSAGGDLYRAGYRAYEIRKLDIREAEVA